VAQGIVLADEHPSATLYLLNRDHVAAPLAVLAAMAATVAICGLRLGRYSRGQDHDKN
jgi:hypothetical protein